MTSVSRGAAEEGDRRRAQERVVGEGPGVFLEREQERIKRRDFGSGWGGEGGVEWEVGGRVIRRELHTVLE